MSALSERIYATVKEEWNRQSKAYQKEHSHANTRFAFKVLSAIVLQDTDSDSLQVLSFGTGTKSVIDETYTQCPDGSVLFNAHAEVIARRAFKRFLIGEIRAHQAQDPSKASSRFLDRFYKGPNSIGYRVRRHLKVHLFISRLPCGSAHVQKPVNSPNLDSLRTFTTCSDKLTMWCVVGLQGALLSRLDLEPIYLESVIVRSEATGAGLEAEKAALAWALTGRLNPNPEREIDLGSGHFTLHSPRSDCISQSVLWAYGTFEDYDFTGKNSDASSPSHNWIQWQGWEFVDPQTGLVHGFNYQKAKNWENSQSRLSKKSLLADIRDLGNANPKKSYYKLKQEALDYQLAKKSVRDAWPSLGLGIWVKRNAEFEDFT